MFSLQASIDDRQCGAGLHREKMNLFYRRCGIPDPVLRETIHKIGTHKILFGTDWPSFFHDQEEARIKSLGLKPEEEYRIFYENAAGLLKII